MGLIGCKFDFNKENENQEELKMREDMSSLKKICEEYNREKFSEEELLNKYKHKYNRDNNYKCEKYYKRHENKNKINGKMNLSKKIFNLKKENELNKGKNINNDEDELIIITPRNNINSENNNNDITDDFTIKNETVVYNIENSAENMKYNTCLNEIKEENKLNLSKEKNEVNNIINTNEVKNMENKMNTNNNDKVTQKKGKNNKSKCSKSFISKRKIITKKLNLNYPNKVKNQKNNIIINEKQKYFNIDQNRKKNNKNNKSFKNSEQKKNKNQNTQTSTLENKNIELNNIFYGQMPMMKKEEILPNIERKTYQEDLFFLDKHLTPQKQVLPGLKNKYFIINENSPINNDNDIVEKLNNIYHALYNKNNSFINCNKNIIPKKSQSPDNLFINNNDNKIFKKRTECHLRNKTYSNQKLNYINNINNNDNKNSFFSLFNNSTNLSINFINKTNKTNKNNKSTKNSHKIITTYIDKHNNSCSDIYNNKLFFNDNLRNQFFNYSNIINNKSSKNNYIKPNLINCKSYSNILSNKKQQSFNKNKTNINKSMNILTKKYRNFIVIYFPTLTENYMISEDIVNNIKNNKFKINFKILDTFDIEKIIYDGIIYKVIDNEENINNDESNKYKLIDRYFQITKNCFKYYNDINEAINEKEKPLVQFDIRYIQNIEIIDNSFLKNCKINENKKVGITFCIYINQNDDFFVFTHNDINIGNNIINILLFLKKYYEKK